MVPSRCQTLHGLFTGGRIIPFLPPLQEWITWHGCHIGCSEGRGGGGTTAGVEAGDEDRGGGYVEGSDDEGGNGGEDAENMMGQREEGK